MIRWLIGCCFWVGGKSGRPGSGFATGQGVEDKINASHVCHSGCQPQVEIYAKFIFIALIPLLMASGMNAQSIKSAQSCTMSNLTAYSKSFVDAFSLCGNPAAATTNQGLSAGVAVEQRFMLKELSVYNIIIIDEFERSAIALQVSYGGFANYNESMCGLSYSRDLGKIRIGTRFNYHRLAAVGYGSASTFSADISLIWQLTEKLRAGIQAINPMPVMFGIDKSESYSSVYKLGLGYEVSEKCFLSMEAAKETAKSVNISFFLQYNLVERFHFRAGLNTDVGQPFLGIGWKLSGLRLYITGSYHPDLGITPGLTLLFSPKQHK
jgi:hypothetical protein